MKRPEDRSFGGAGIEEQILQLLYAHRKLTFLAIADIVPQYTWRDLLAALNRLRERRRVEVSPLRWDYEVVLTPETRDGTHADGQDEVQG
ncbi:hypothetical protein [Candidatus Nitrospira bockiana]